MKGLEKDLVLSLSRPMLGKTEINRNTSYSGFIGSNLNNKKF